LGYTVGREIFRGKQRSAEFQKPQEERRKWGVSVPVGGPGGGGTDERGEGRWAKGCNKWLKGGGGLEFGKGGDLYFEKSIARGKEAARKRVSGKAGLVGSDRNDD